MKESSTSGAGSRVGSRQALRTRAGLAGVVAAVAVALFVPAAAQAGTTGRYEAPRRAQGTTATVGDKGPTPVPSPTPAPPLSTASTQAPGTYLLKASVRSQSPGRVDLTVGGEMVGSFATTTSWKSVSAVVRLAAGEQVGVRSVPLPGNVLAGPVDVDGLTLTPATVLDTARGSRILDGNGSTRRYEGVNVPI